MEKTLRSCADQIVEASIRAVLPDEAVRRALKDFHPEGRTIFEGRLCRRPSHPASDKADATNASALSRSSGLTWRFSSRRGALCPEGRRSRLLRFGIKSLFVRAGSAPY